MTTIDKPIYPKFDRFDFEQQIMECWNVTSDIQTVTEYLLDAPLEANREDKIANMLMGIEALYNAKFDKLFRQFEALVNEHARTLDKEYHEEKLNMKPWTDEELDKVWDDLENIPEDSMHGEVKL